MYMTYGLYQLFYGDYYHIFFSIAELRGLNAVLNAQKRAIPHKIEEHFQNSHDQITLITEFGDHSALSQELQGRGFYEIDLNEIKKITANPTKSSHGKAQRRRK